MDPTITVTVIVICAQLARLGSLALRLRSNVRRHRHQLDMLTTLAARLPLDVLVELEASHGRGGGLRLRTSTQPHRGEPDVRT